MTALAQRLAAMPVNRSYFWLIGAWVLSMISLPILRWVWGDSVIPAAATAGVLFQFVAVFAILRSAWGWRRTGIALGLVAVLTWGAEFIGHNTGFPFGDYHYTDMLQPQVAGVPLLIPLAWFMMLVPAWAIARAILGDQVATWRQRLVFVILSAVAITAWDLFLDPQMVGWGFWIWDQPGGYFGIPWLNYFGWLLTAGTVTLVVNPGKMPITPLLFVYAVVWVLQSIGLAVFWSQPGPALFGAIGMGTMLAASLYGVFKMRGTSLEVNDKLRG